MITKSLPLYVSNFNEMITGNYVYVDKTEYIYPLVKKKDIIFYLDPVVLVKHC